MCGGAPRGRRAERYEMSEQEGRGRRRRAGKARAPRRHAHRLPPAGAHLITKRGRAGAAGAAGARSLLG